MILPLHETGRFQFRKSAGLPPKTLALFSRLLPDIRQPLGHEGSPSGSCTRLSSAAAVTSATRNIHSFRSQHPPVATRRSK
ncbi:unnamed protein product, partial [Sphacelaria rigidula]